MNNRELLDSWNRVTDKEQTKILNMLRDMAYMHELKTIDQLRQASNPDNWKLEGGIIEKKAILEYFNTQEKGDKTLVKWFENFTGCIWVLSRPWEGFACPEGDVLSRKLDDVYITLDESE